MIRHRGEPERHCDRNLITMAIFYSSGDLGDVGRHVVEAALAVPADVLGEIRVFSSNTATLKEPVWGCGCGKNHGFGFSNTNSQRLVLQNIDLTKDSVEPLLVGVDVIISCLGSRTPFQSSDCNAQVRSANILKSMSALKINHILMLSSVGISDDWPPLEWTFEESKRLQGYFRTICWTQYQDLSAAEILLNELLEQDPRIRSLVVRVVLLNETDEPTGQWYVQQRKHEDHPHSRLAKMDCARFLVQEAIQPSIVQRAVVLGGMPPTETNKNRAQLEEEND